MIKMDVNGVAVARPGLILSQDGATTSRMLFKGPRGLFYLIFGLKISKLDHWTKKYRKIRYFLLWSGPVYFLLYGEPWHTQHAATCYVGCERCSKLE